MGPATPLTPLGRLIAEVQAANKWSYAEISHNAFAGGRKLSKSRVESLRNDSLPSISTKAIEALAAGLKVSPDRVAYAAMESMGYSVAPEGATAAEALAGDPTLSDPMRRVLLAALDAARAESAGVALAPTEASRKARDRAQPPAGSTLQRSAADRREKSES